MEYQLLKCRKLIYCITSGIFCLTSEDNFAPWETPCLRPSCSPWRVPLSKPSLYPSALKLNLKKKKLITRESLTGPLLWGKNQTYSTIVNKNTSESLLGLFLWDKPSLKWKECVKTSFILSEKRLCDGLNVCQNLLKQILKSGDTTLTFLLPTQYCQKYLHFHQTLRPMRDFTTTLLNISGC